MPRIKAHPVPVQDEDVESLESLNCCQLKVHQRQILQRQRDFREDPTSPLKGRSCTDIICLFIFVIFIGVWVALGVFAFKNGTPDDLFAPVDSENRKCGHDEGVETKPNLFFFDISTCAPGVDSTLFRCNTPQVCVEKCPKENFYFDFYDNSNKDSINYIADRMICLDGFDKSKLTSLQTMRDAVSQEKCARWYLESTQVAHRCLPKQLSSWVDPTKPIDITLPTESSGNANTIISGVTGIDLSQASDVVKALSAVNEFGQAVVKDLTEVWPWILFCIGIAALVCFLYIVIMRWLAGILVWLSLFACIAALSFCSYKTWERYRELADEPEPDSPARLGANVKTDPILGALKSQWESYLRMKETWLAFFIISVSLLATILIIVIFLRNRIRLAVALINEGSKAVASSWSTLFFPIFPWVIQIAVICYGVAICTFLFATGAPIYRVSGLADAIDGCSCNNGYKEHDLCTEDEFEKHCRTSGGSCSGASCAWIKDEAETYTVYLQLFNLFVFLWGLFFVSAFGQMVLASTFATYYWTFDKSKLPFFTVATSSGRVIRYHLGTVAFGSLLLAICNWIRVMIEVVYNHISKYNDSWFIKAVRCCLSCFFWCLDKFLRFLNKNAYIMCAIHGKNFCASAKDAFSLLLRNVVRVFVLDKVTDFLFFVSKLTITAAMGVLSFYLFSNPVAQLNSGGEETYQARYYFVPIFFVCIATYCIASLFFGVYSMAVDTLFLCFLEDCEINDGSAEKPYFMSKNLMKILGRKNMKVPKEERRKAK